MSLNIRQTAAVRYQDSDNFGAGEFGGEQNSTDGEHFTEYGSGYVPRTGNYRGDYIGIYTYNNSCTGGYVDVDYFRYEYE